MLLLSVDGKIEKYKYFFVIDIFCYRDMCRIKIKLFFFFSVIFLFLVVWKLIIVFIVCIIIDVFLISDIRVNNLFLICYGG